MRILSLTVRNFRGFGSAATTVSLDADLILIFGPNGFGKTSLAEAIEWLFYGTTKRRQQGELYSRAEYANSFANAHGGSPTQVDALVRIGGRELTLSRRLTQGERSETLVDGSVVSFASVPILPIEAVYPVVAQHGLQTFVHSKPKDRRDAICAALGLDELTSLKNTLDSARSSFQRTPPRPVAEARNVLAANVSGLSQIEETKELARRWAAHPLAVDLATDLAALRAAAEALTGRACGDTEAALGHLRERRQAASRSVFDAGKIAPDESAATLAPEELKRLSAQIGAIERAIAATVAVTASLYSSALLEFWHTGITLVPEGERCPMCEAETLTAEKRSEIAKRLLDNADRIAKHTQLKAAIEAAEAQLKKADAAIETFGVQALTDVEQQQLSRLYSEHEADLAEFTASFANFHSTNRQLTESLESIETFLKSCASDLDDVRTAPRVTSEAARLKDLCESIAVSSGVAMSNYHEVWKRFEPGLSLRISSDEVIAQIDAVGKSLKAEPQMQVLDRYERVLAETQQLIRYIEGEMQRRQNALLVTRGAEVKDLYDRLNRGANVVFDTMEPGTEAMRLHASSFGTRMSAAANLSECQLNCLGLSMWLMRATTPSSPFKFVLLDDPVQSMDDDHTEAFISDIVPLLLDHHGKQVIVLSHVKRITERLRELNGSRAIKLYHYESYERAGPTIVEQVKLQQLLAEIKGAALGNESNRKFAVDRIRVLIEQIIRELHLKVMGTPTPSPQYDRASAAQLLPLFRSITGTTQQEYVGLQDSVRFCDPAHHTQVGYSVPVRSNIQPHIDRLDTLIKRYGLSP